MSRLVERAEMRRPSVMQARKRGKCSRVCHGMGIVGSGWAEWSSARTRARIEGLERRW